ncbi:unnamed protein product [Polarella glacialis]|uniref:Uncharacterized protein n=1 Tax=Polarella glacialis TaxID=89957 RepID=A0A813LK18_POLGL|nr:unnamed protein product [Polarella glacialis]
MVATSQSSDTDPWNSGHDPWARRPHSKRHGSSHQWPAEKYSRGNGGGKGGSFGSGGKGPKGRGVSGGHARSSDGTGGSPSNDVGEVKATWFKQSQQQQQQLKNWYVPLDQLDEPEPQLRVSSGMGRGRLATNPGWIQNPSIHDNLLTPEARNVTPALWLGSDLDDATSDDEELDAEWDTRTLNGTWKKFGSVPQSYADKYGKTIFLPGPVPRDLREQLCEFVAASTNGKLVESRSFVVTEELVGPKARAEAPVLPVSSMVDWAEARCAAQREQQRRQQPYDQQQQQEDVGARVIGVGSPELELCKVVQDTVAGEAGLDHGFVLGVITAWCRHLPLVLKPDHIMLLILQAISRHVNDQPEDLRSRLMTHTGKITLEVEVDAGVGHDMMAPKFINAFAEKVHNFATPAATRAFAMPFSTATETDKLAANIALMDANKHFFEFSYGPFCGFPTITLMGNTEDWRQLRTQAEEAIKALTSFDFAFKWLPALLPVLDRFVSASLGEPVDACFWNAMCKRCGIREPVYSLAKHIGYNGWIQVFFPSLQGESNPLCVPYSSSHAYATSGLRDFFLEIRAAEENLGKFVPADAMPSGLGAVPLVEFECGFNGVGSSMVALLVSHRILSPKLCVRLFLGTLKRFKCWKHALCTLLQRGYLECYSCLALMLHLSAKASSCCTATTSITREAILTLSIIIRIDDNNCSNH